MCFFFSWIYFIQRLFFSFFFLFYPYCSPCPSCSSTPSLLFRPLIFLLLATSHLPVPQPHPANLIRRHTHHTTTTTRQHDNTDNSSHNRHHYDGSDDNSDNKQQSWSPSQSQRRPPQPSRNHISTDNPLSPFLPAHLAERQRFQPMEPAGKRRKLAPKLHASSASPTSDSHPQYHLVRPPSPRALPRRPRPPSSANHLSLIPLT